MCTYVRNTRDHDGTCASPEIKRDGIREREREIERKRIGRGMRSKRVRGKDTRRANDTCWSNTGINTVQCDKSVNVSSLLLLVLSLNHWAASGYAIVSLSLHSPIGLLLCLCELFSITPHMDFSSLLSIIFSRVNNNKSLCAYNIRNLLLFSVNILFLYNFILKTS